MASNGAVEDAAVEAVEVTDEMEGELDAMGKGEDAGDEKLG